MAAASWARFKNPDICTKFPDVCGNNGDDTETESEGPKPRPTSNRTASNTLTSEGCALGYDSDKDGEGVVCRDVYLVFGGVVEGIVVVIIKVEEMMLAAQEDVSSVDPAFIIGIKTGGCKKAERSITSIGIAVKVQMTFNLSMKFLTLMVILRRGQWHWYRQTWGWTG